VACAWRYGLRWQSMSLRRRHLYAQLTKPLTPVKPSQTHQNLSAQKKAASDCAKAARSKRLECRGYLPPCFFSILPQVSFKVAARLYTGAPGLLSFSSAQK